VLIAVLLFAPARQFPAWSFTNLIPGFDKWVHGFLFLFLFVFLLFGLFGQHYFAHRRLLSQWLAISFSILYALCTEAIQGFMENGRTADKWDFAADLAGIFAGFFVCLLWKKSFPFPLKRKNGTEKT
jgi:VanZ family protein